MKRQLLAIILIISLVFGCINLNIGHAMEKDSLKIVKVAAGGYHSMVIKSDGSLWGFGGNYEGQLGSETTANYSNVPLHIMNDVSEVAASMTHTMAIKKDGTLWGWGDNSKGAIGDGTTINRHTPVKVMEDVRKVAVGLSYTMAIKNDGTLWGWGNNTSNKLGDGTTVSHNRPVQILTDVVEIATGHHNTMAIKKDGTLWGWGNNSSGQLGIGSTEFCLFNISMNIMSDVKAVAVGASFTMALKNDGTLWAFGDNKHGQLGDGTNVNRNKPVKIMNDVAYVDASYNTTMVIKTDGTLWSFGDNVYGELGDDTKVKRNKPIQVMKDVSSVSAGMFHTLVIKKDGSLWGFGHNSAGKLGDGTSSDSSIPVKSILNEEISIQAKEPSETEIIVKVDGKKVEFIQAPIIKEGKVLAPLRAIFESLGMTVQWIQETKSIIASKDKLTIKLEIGNKNAIVEKEGNKTIKTTLDVPPQIINGNTLVPVRFIGEATGANVEWDQSKRIVDIKSNSMVEEKKEDLKKLGVTIGDFHINLGDSSNSVVQKLGKPNRIDENVTRLKWYVYNSDYSKFIMIGMFKDKVSSIYTSHTNFMVNDIIKYGTNEDKLPKSEWMKYHIDHINGNTLYGIMISDENAGGLWGPVLDNNELTPYFELQQVDCVNAFRVYNGLNALKIDEIAQKTAREHSKDMAEKDYFDHTALDGRSPWDRYNDNNGRYFACAENIVAGHSNGFQQFEAFLNSSGHRNNMLHNRAQYVGIGVYYKLTSKYKYYGTQLFSY